MATHREILKEQLANEIAEKTKRLQEMEQDPTTAPIIEASDYTVEEKVKYFDQLHRSAMSIVKDTEENGWENEDNAMYVYEDFLKILNLKNPTEFYKYYKTLTN